jgi:hypothetical protein
MDDLNWRNSIQWSTQPLDMLCLGTTEIARLSQNVVTLAWDAILDQHLDYEKRTRRPCSSYEAGRAGAEQWAMRHEERIRREIGERRAARWR